MINFTRASSTQTTTAGLPGTEGIDQLSVATDTLPMIETTSPVSNAVALSAAQLDYIYTANTGSCLTWNDTTIGGASGDTIIPIIPQVGSGTRKTFLQDIGDTALTVGNCTVVGEENDPTAMASTSNPADAIEPIAESRLDLYTGVTNARYPMASVATSPTPAAPTSVGPRDVAAASSLTTAGPPPR